MYLGKDTKNTVACKKNHLTNARPNKDELLS